MLVYEGIKSGFIDDVNLNKIVDYLIKKVYNDKWIITAFK